MPAREPKGRGNSNTVAGTVYKVRISKSFIDADYGEGFLVEVWDFRTQRLAYCERYKELEPARKRQREIKNDLGGMSLERFQQAYMSRTRRQ